MSGDILGRIDEAVAEHGSCPCGRELPDDCPSSYWCGEACQTAWSNHMVNPEHWSHPRDIRERQEQALQDAVARQPVRVRLPGEPATPLWGMHDWRAPDGDTADVWAYLRWCPQCQGKRPWVIVDDPDEYADPQPWSLLVEHRQVQECQECHRRWPGRPLVGKVEQHDGPSFAQTPIRLSLGDGYRTATSLISRRSLESCRDPSAILAMEWERLEEMVCDGLSDRQRQERGHPAPSRLTYWDWRTHHVLAAPVMEPSSLLRITDVS